VLAHFAKEVEFLGLRGVWVPLRKLSAYFLCAGGKFGEVVGVFLTEKPNALRGGTECWPLASGVLLGLTKGSKVHRTHWSESGAQRPVCRHFVTLSTHGSGEHRTLPVLSVW